MARRSNRDVPPPREPSLSDGSRKPIDRRPNNYSDGSGSRALGDHILPFVRIECAKCNRRGQYNTAKLLAKYGPYQQMVELKWLLTQCRRKDYTDYCGVQYTDARWLAGMTDELAPPWKLPRPALEATPPQLGRPWRPSGTPPQRCAN
jgi:hypothetical protein